MEKRYKYLEELKNPQVLVKAIELYGTKEIVGKQHNSVILGWAKELGLQKEYTADEIPWCGLFVAICVKRATYEPVAKPLWARNWANFGNKQKVAALGDILVFVRDGGGHVGFYVGEDKNNYHVLGGNQGNMVNITRIEKRRCISINRCPWKIKQPSVVRPILLDATGPISTNEA